MVKRFDEYINIGREATWRRIQTEIKDKAPKRQIPFINKIKHEVYANANVLGASLHILPINMPRDKTHTDALQIHKFPKVFVKNPHCLGIVRFFYDPHGTVRSYLVDKLNGYGDAVYCTLLNLPKYVLKRDALDLGACILNLLCITHCPPLAPVLVGVYSAFEIWSVLVGIGRTFFEVYIASRVCLGDKKAM